jgi:hypothetical protein
MPTCRHSGAFYECVIIQWSKNPDLSCHQYLFDDSNSKKRLNMPGSLHTILKIPEVNIFEKKPILQLVNDAFKQKIVLLPVTS